MAARDHGSAWVFLAAWLVALSLIAVMAFGFGIWVVILGLATAGGAWLFRRSRAEATAQNERRTT